MLFERFPHLMIGPILATLAWTILIGLLAWVLVFKTRIFNPFNEVRFDSFFCGLLNIIFVFFMAFMGSEFYEKHKAASESLVKEKTAVNQLLTTALPTEALNQQVRDAIKSYLQAVTEVEWKQHLNQRQNDEAQQAIRQLLQWVNPSRQACANHGTTQCIDTFTMSRYLAGVDALREARDIRLALGVQDREGLRYLLCMLLALNAAISLLLVYKNEKRAALVPLVMYCVSVWVTFLIVILHADPYIGFRGIQPTMLEHLLQQLG